MSSPFFLMSSFLSVQLHEKCRKKYFKESSQISQSINEVPTEFSFDTHCLFCGYKVSICSGRTSTSKVFHTVKTPNFLDTLHRVITERNDFWGTEVSIRIRDESDLVSVKVVYHHQCNVNFKTNKKNPRAESCSRKGAPINSELNESFLHLTRFLETSNELHSTSDLKEKFKEFSRGETYTTRYLKDKLIEFFGDRILFLSRTGLSDIVVMRETGYQMLIKNYEDKSRKSQEIENAAGSILEDIKSIANNKHSYPLPHEISSLEFGLSFMPQSLVKFLTIILDHNTTDQSVKVVSIGHAIIQACRPRCLLSPVQLGLGVQISVLTASR